MKKEPASEATVETQNNSTSRSLHTLGPWCVYNYEDRDGFTIQSAETAEMLADTIGNNFANARLIAAAPELLEALKAIATHGEPIYPADWTRMKDAGLAAIAKAEGASSVPSGLKSENATRAS